MMIVATATNVDMEEPPERRGEASEVPDPTSGSDELP